MTDSWTARSTLGNILKDMIKIQKKNFDKVKDPFKKAKLAANISFMIQVQASLIRDEKNIDKRIQRLEELERNK